MFLNRATNLLCLLLSHNFQSVVHCSTVFDTFTGRTMSSSDLDTVQVTKADTASECGQGCNLIRSTCSAFLYSADSQVCTFGSIDVNNYLYGQPGGNSASGSDTVYTRDTDASASGTPTCASLPSSMTIKANKYAFTGESSSSVSYPVAKSYCESRGMKMPMFRTEEEYDALVSLADGDLWVGLLNPDLHACAQAVCGGKHIWDDGQATVFEWQSFYSPLGMDNLDGDACIRMMNSGKMEDKECDVQLKFRCVLQCE